MASRSQLTLAIPNFNGARYLEETLRSLSHNRPYVRWWFQDGCSSDGSVAIARRYATPGDGVVTEPDTGQADALNRAFRHMGGDVIGFLNSDDVLADGAAKLIVDAFGADPDLDILYGEVEWADAAGNITGHHVGSIDSLEDIIDIYRVWWNRRQWVQPEVFLRRRLWDKVGVFDTRYDLAFDYDYWVRCFIAGAKVKRLPRVLARFRRHSAQKSARALQAADEIRDIVERALASAPPIPSTTRLYLRTRLSYDRYQIGRTPTHRAGNDSFARMLAIHPLWLSLPEVRRRLRSALTRRIQLLF